LTRQPAHLVSLVNWINLLGLYFICVCCLLLFLDFPHLCLFGGSAGDPRADGSCGKITFLDSWAQNSGDWERVAGDIFMGHIYIYIYFFFRASNTGDAPRAAVVVPVVVLLWLLLFLLHIYFYIFFFFRASNTGDAPRAAVVVPVVVLLWFLLLLLSSLLWWWWLFVVVYWLVSRSVGWLFVCLLGCLFVSFFRLFVWLFVCLVVYLCVCLVVCLLVC
jgi:hypothetical protein